jgi:hypothetical protein
VPTIELSDDDIRTLQEALHGYIYAQRVAGSNASGPAWEWLMDRAGEAQRLLERLEPLA